MPVNPTLYRIALGPNSVGKALALVEAITGRAAEGTRARLAVVVEELVVNLVDHGDGGSAIWLGLEPVGEGVRVVLIDDSAPFDPRVTPLIGDRPNEERGGGAGLAIVRAWSRIVGYDRVDEHNRLEIVVAADSPD